MTDEEFMELAVEYDKQAAARHRLMYEAYLADYALVEADAWYFFHTALLFAQALDDSEQNVPLSLRLTIPSH